MSTCRKIIALFGSMDYTRCPELWRNLPPLNMADLDMTGRQVGRQAGYNNDSMKTYVHSIGLDISVSRPTNVLSRSCFGHNQRRSRSRLGRGAWRIADLVSVSASIFRSFCDDIVNVSRIILLLSVLFVLGSILIGTNPLTKQPVEYVLRIICVYYSMLTTRMSWLTSRLGLGRNGLVGVL